MLRALWLLVVSLTVALAGAAAAAPVSPDPVDVTTDNETPVLYDDDDDGGNASGDDPAIWVHPADSSHSIVIATAKEGTEVTAREQGFLFSEDRAEVEEEHTAYGVAVYQPGDGATYAVVTQEGDTAIATVRLVPHGEAIGYGEIIRIELPGEFPLPDGSIWVPCEEPGIRPQLEGVAVDQRTGTLYAAQEDVGLWRIELPLGSSEPRLLDKVADFGVHDAWNEETEECEPIDSDAPSYGGPNLVADAEDVDIYYGPGRTGYLLVSSQGDDRFAVYTLLGRNGSLGTFRVRGAGVDDVNGSDGLAVTNRPVGEYAEGLLVTHDEPETGPDVDPDRDPTSFSYVQWGDIADALDLRVDTTSGNDPRLR